MSEQIPAEFAPGDKVLVHQSPVKCEVIRKLSEHWLEVLSEDGKNAYRVPVQFAASANSITLTLTREQAKRFIADVDCLMPMGFYGAHPEIGKLKKQIEEKLSK